MGWSLKAGPEGSGSSPHCGLRQLQGAGRTVRGSGVRPRQHRLPAALPQQPGSAPTARCSLCKRPPSGGLGHLPNSFAYPGSVFCFLPEQKVGTQKLLGKGLRLRARSEMGAESRNKEEKSVAEDLRIRSCQWGEGVGPENFCRTQQGGLESGTQLNGR